MCPGCSQYRAYALGYDDHIFHCGLAVCCGETYEFFNILHRARQRGAITTLTRRVPVTTCIPGIKYGVWHRQFIHNMLQPPGMFVSTMEQNNHFGCHAWRRRRPVTIKQHGVIAGQKMSLVWHAYIIHVAAFLWFVAVAATAAA